MAVRNTQTTVRVLVTRNAEVRASQVVVRVLVTRNAEVRASQVVVRVLRTVATAAPPSTGARRRPVYVVTS